MPTVGISGGVTVSSLCDHKVDRFLIPTVQNGKLLKVKT